MQFKVISDLDKLGRKLEAIDRNMDRALARGINRAAKRVKSIAGREVKARTGLKLGTVNKKLFVKTASPSNLSASIDSSKGKIYNLITSVPMSKRKPGYFNSRVGRGNTKRYRSSGVKTKAWNKNREYKGTFIVQTSRGPLVAKRKGSGREGLSFTKGPSIRGSFRSDHVKQVMKKRTKEVLDIEIKRSVEFEVRKRTKTN